MQAINILQAKSLIFRLVAVIEQGRKGAIIIASNGHRVAIRIRKRIGVAKCLCEVPNSMGAHIDEVAHLFLSGGKRP